MSGARVVWITGLSGAGKSTLAAEVARRIKAAGRAAVLLDGDELRWVLGGEAASFDRAARVELALRYARLAAVFSCQGLDVVVATISLFREVHGWNRANLQGYLEIYLRVPLPELRRRDPKGLYSRYDLGQAREVAGLDLRVDEPGAPDLLFDFDPGFGVEAMTEAVMLRLQQGHGP